MPIIQSLDRALLILNLFEEGMPELKITEISARMNLHKSTVHSLLKTLQLHGYIDQNQETGKYRLGLKLLERSNYLLQSLDIRTIARKKLLELSANTGQTVHLVILDGREGVYIDKVEGAHSIIRYSRIGRRVPLHTSSVGKALLAAKPESELEGILSGYVYKVHTPRTITNQEAFLQELDRVRVQGYALDDQENEPGVRCVGVPIYDHSGQSIAAISISTVVSAVPDEELTRFTEQLRQAAEALSHQLGYGYPVLKS